MRLLFQAILTVTGLVGCDSTCMLLWMFAYAAGFCAQPTLELLLLVILPRLRQMGNTSELEKMYDT